jgi:hypothetical protein
MAAAVFDLSCPSTGASLSLNTGSYSVLNEGTALGASVAQPVLGQVFDSQRVSVAGASTGSREQQLRVRVQGSSLADLAAKLDALYALCEDVTRRGGGELAHTSTDGAHATRWRVGVAQVGAPERMGAHYERSLEAVVVVALAVDPFGMGPEARLLTSGSLVFPRVLTVPAPGGTTDALAAVAYTATTGVPSVMLYAWWPAVAAHNMVWNGGAEAIGTSATVAYGWVASAVSGVIAAATSVTRTTTAGKFRSGVAGFEVITPATTDTGASFRLYRRGGFKAGTTYTARCFVKAVSGTTAVRIKLGVSGDLGTGTASALTAGWVVRTVTWTPAATSDTAYFAVGVNAATATTFQVDDVQVFEGTTAPAFEQGGYGPGIIPGAAYDLAKASLAGGTAWTQTTDANYVAGLGPKASGAVTTNGNLEFPILPHLFTPDDYTDDEVQVAVFARLEIASTQTSASCAISVASDRGTLFGVRRWGSFSSAGKALRLPSGGTHFRPVFLGTITLKVDRARPRREWLRLAFANSGAATGTLGVDHLLVVPVRSCARSQSGDSSSLVPLFLATTASTKRVEHDGSGWIVEADGIAMTPDDGLGGSRLRIPRGGCELLVWPSTVVVDVTDSSTASMTATYTGAVVVDATPRYHLLRQA